MTTTELIEQLTQQIDAEKQDLLARLEFEADRANALEQEVADLKASEDLRRAADKRAIAMWQEKTGKSPVWPDHSDLCVWLMEVNAALADTARRLAERNGAMFDALENCLQLELSDELRWQVVRALEGGEK